MYEDAKRGARWLITPGAPVQEGGLLAFTDQLKQVTTVYICDVGGRGSPEPLICAACTIVLSSPDDSHYHEWLKLKKKPAVYMPSWSSDEVTAVVPTIYPQRFLADGATSIYPARFKLYGGIARSIFSPDTDDRMEVELNKVVKSCNLTALFHSIESGERLGPLQQLVHYTVQWFQADGSTPDFRTASMDFSSDAIADRIMQQKDAEEQNEVVTFLTSATGKPDVGGMRGKVFERYAHRLLSAGGNFKYRWENDPTHTANPGGKPISFPPMVQKGIVGSLAALAAGVSTDNRFRVRGGDDMSCLYVSVVLI